jgi:hypothetical protein
MSAADFKGKLTDRFLPWQWDDPLPNSQKVVDKRLYAIYYLNIQVYQINQKNLLRLRYHVGGKHQWQERLLPYVQAPLRQAPVAARLNP